MNCSRSNTHTIFLALYFSLVVQFSMTVRRLLFFAATLILYHIKSPLSIPFLKVFSLFLIFFRGCDKYPSPWATCDIIARYFALVKYIFCGFYPFYTFLAFCPKYVRQNGRLFCRKSKKPSTTVIKVRKRWVFYLIIYTLARGENKTFYNSALSVKTNP